MTDIHQRDSTGAPVVGRVSVIRPLARIEGLRLLRHPFIWVGTLLSVALLVALPEEAGAVLELARASTFVGLGLVPLAAAALLTSHNGASRPQRQDTETLFESLPARSSERTAGLLVAGLAVLVPATLAVAVWAGYLVAVGTTGSFDLVELATGPAVVVLAATVGTAAGVWAPSRALGMVTLAVFLVLNAVLHGLQGPVHWFAWWRTVPIHLSAELWVRPAAQHLAYVVAVTAFVGTLGLLRHGATARRTAGAVVAGTLAAAVGATQLALPDEQTVSAVLDQIENPHRYWECEVVDGVETCVFPNYAGWRADIARTVNTTLEPVPNGETPAITVAQHQSGSIGQLRDEFPVGHPRLEELSSRAYVQPAFGWPIYVDTARSDEVFHDGFGLALAAASRAIGLPIEPVEQELRVDHRTYEQSIARAREGVNGNLGGDVPEHIRRQGEPGEFPDSFLLPDGSAIVWRSTACRPTDQARAAIALWLAARGSEQRTATLTNASHQAVSVFWPAGHTTPDGRPAPAAPDGDITGLPSPGRLPVIWTPEAIHAAGQLVAIDPANRISGDWERWTDPSTSLGELVAAFDLEPYPATEELFRDAGVDPAAYTDWIDSWPYRPDDTVLTKDPVCP